MVAVARLACGRMGDPQAVSRDMGGARERMAFESG